ncbi:MAG: polyprenyl synthetase family protein, partial [Sphingomicrobium sp.]
MAVELIDRARADFEAESNRLSAEIDSFFTRLLEPPGDARDRLYEAMCHATVGGGKRLRPLLISAAAQLFAINPERALRVGAAIEAIHVYSLIHDDL